MQQFIKIQCKTYGKTDGKFTGLKRSYEVDSRLIDLGFADNYGFMDACPSVLKDNMVVYLPDGVDWMTYSLYVNDDQVAENLTIDQVLAMVK